MESVIAAVAVATFVAIVATHSEPPMLVELKQRYWSLLKVLEATQDPTWRPLLEKAIITGTRGKRDGVIGSNVNKGYEIYICLDGDDVNSAMYVLIHEMAHMAVTEYDHTDAYWAHFKNLKQFCIKNEIYFATGDREYCGEAIRDA